jgi:hypothetical protein
MGDAAYYGAGIALAALLPYLVRARYRAYVTGGWADPSAYEAGVVSRRWLAENVAGLVALLALAAELAAEAVDAMAGARVWDWRVLATAVSLLLTVRTGC